MLPGLIIASRQTTDLAKQYDREGTIVQRAHADTFADPLLQQRAPLREAPLHCRGIAQAHRDRSQPVSAARGTTEGQALVEQLYGLLQVPLSEVQVTEAGVDNDRYDPLAFQRGETERLLSVAPALVEGSELAQDSRQPRLRPAPQESPERVRRPVRRRHAPPQQLNRQAEVADGIVCLPQVIGCFHLQDAVAEHGREFEGLLARRNK